MRKQTLAILFIFILLFLATQLAAVRVAEAGVACASGPQSGIATVTLGNGQSEIVTISYPRAFCKAPVIVVTGYEEVTRVRLGVVTVSTVTLIVDGSPGEARLAWQGSAPSK